MQVQTGIYVAAFALLLAASVLDIKKQEIAGWMMAGAAALSVTACILQWKEVAASEMALSVLPGVVLILLAVLFRGSFGMGDGIFAACLGPVFGVAQMASGIFFALLFGAMAGIALIVSRKGSRKSTLPFVPLLTLGMGVTQLVS